MNGNATNTPSPITSPQEPSPLNNADIYGDKFFLLITFAVIFISFCVFGIGFAFQKDIKRLLRRRGDYHFVVDHADLVVEENQSSDRDDEKNSKDRIIEMTAKSEDESSSEKSSTKSDVEDLI